MNMPLAMRSGKSFLQRIVGLRSLGRSGAGGLPRTEFDEAAFNLGRLLGPAAPALRTFSAKFHFRPVADIPNLAIFDTPLVSTFSVEFEAPCKPSSSG